MDRLFEVSSYASFIVYHIEAMDKIKVPKRVIREYVNLQKTVSNFPTELNYICSFIEYDVKESVVFNAAPIYLIGGIDIFMDKEVDGELYATRMKKYLRNMKKIAIKKATFTGSVKRIVSEYDIFTRIAELLSIGYYVGDEIIVKEAGMHGIKSFLDIYNKSFGSSFEGEENQDGYLSSEYKDFDLAEIGVLSNFSEERIVGLEKQLNMLLTSDTVISNLNKNPYNVNFEFFIKAILKNIEKDKEK